MFLYIQSGTPVTPSRIQFVRYHTWPRIFSVDIAPSLTHAGTCRYWFNLRSSELDQRLVVLGRIESSAHVPSLVFVDDEDAA